METIIAASQKFAGKASCLAANDDSDDENDPHCQLVRKKAVKSNSKEGSKEEGGELDEVEVVSGWGYIPKSIQDLSASSDVDPIQDTPVPKKKGKEPVKPCPTTNKASSSTGGQNSYKAWMPRAT